jgi:apolipoprotein N-acyltransferase
VALAWRLSLRRELAFAFLFAATWALNEWLRATLFTGFAWNPLAVIWLPIPWIPHSARWIGTYGLSGLFVLTAGGLVYGYHRERRITLITFIGFALIGYFWVGIRSSPATNAGIPVRVVQPNISQEEKYDSTQDERHARMYAILSGKPTAVARLVLWPEAAVPHFLEYESEARAQLATLLGPRDILITGAESVALDPRGSNDVYHNSVFALDSSGELLWRYDKAHLVPFGEYLPLRPLLSRIGLSRLVPGDGDFEPGPGPRTFRLPGFENSSGGQSSIGLQICYEIVFSGRVLDESSRPTFLFNPSNDAWFGAWGPPQHLAQAQLRAIEEGISVVRATPNGISAVIDPMGHVVAAIPRHRAGVIDASVPAPRSPPLFARFGLWTSLLFSLCLGAAGIVLRGRKG